MRTSSFINRKQASNILKAQRFADEIGLPLVVYATVNFAHTGCRAGDVSKAFEKLRDNHFAPWLRRRPRPRIAQIDPPAYVWVIENAAGQTHVHWQLHLPERLVAPFREVLPRWVEKVTMEITATEACHVQRADRPRGATVYMMKGIDPRCAKAYRIRPEAQGNVVGKRCGMSKSLGPTARRTYMTRTATPPAQARSVAA